MISYGDQPEKNIFADQKVRYPYRFYPLLIHVTPKVEEILESKEAKHYLADIKRAALKLERMFERECKENAIKGPMEQKEYVEQLEEFLDANVPTWRAEIGDFDAPKED